ncbi:IS110 family transposase [Secundilactobacillus folii]|uniref:IS110 family transposase n=1 Tax=Secundilactobacillus folii TaxID=2678357 RepID=A0A7X3C389_9LACO|nr:IS110 family transposase [Secundilactobacillus folii]
MYVIGIDVSRGHSDCALVRKDEVLREFKIKHDKNGFSQLLSIINDCKFAVTIVFETTGVYSSQLGCFCRQFKLDYVEMNPLDSSINMDSMRRNKTDRSDAVNLAFLQINQPGKVSRRHFIGGDYADLHVLSHQYFQLSVERGRVMNHLHAALEQSFPELNDIFIPIKSVLGLTTIKKYPHPNFLLGKSLDQMVTEIRSAVSLRLHTDTIRLHCQQVITAGQISYPAISADSMIIQVIRQYCDQIFDYNQRIDDVSKALIKLAQTLPEFRLISSIPGTGQKSTALLLGCVGNISRFTTYKQFNAFVGIDIRRYQSGASQKLDIINRRGRQDARKVLFEMIRSMLRNQSHLDNHIVDYYYLLKKGPHPKPDKIAVIACINRLNRTIINLVRTNQVYDFNKTSHK